MHYSHLDGVGHRMLSSCSKNFFHTLLGKQKRGFRLSYDESLSALTETSEPLSSLEHFGL